MRPNLTHADRVELWEALIVRYRRGELGPISFAEEARAAGMNGDDIKGAIVEFREECAKNRRA
jgi:hypothetical protein